MTGHTKGRDNTWKNPVALSISLVRKGPPVPICLFSRLNPPLVGAKRPGEDFEMLSVRSGRTLQRNDEQRVQVACAEHQGDCMRIAFSEPSVLTVLPTGSTGNLRCPVFYLLLEDLAVICDGGEGFHLHSSRAILLIMVERDIGLYKMSQLGVSLLAHKLANPV